MKQLFLICIAVLFQFSCGQHNDCTKNKGIIKITSHTYPQNKYEKEGLKTIDSLIYFTSESFDAMGKTTKYKSYRLDRPEDSTVIQYVYTKEKLPSEVVQENYEGEKVYELTRTVIEWDHNNHPIEYEFEGAQLEKIFSNCREASSRLIDPDGKTIKRSLYNYDENAHLTSSTTSFQFEDMENENTVKYSNYTFDSKGQWTSREESNTDKSVYITKRTIEYQNK